ncbi:DUF2335 domain-containing protein [Croceicoccus sp. YJ47]|uniref:DUF2335 domain-containing protein n=1 Tax=Croceicoccus sp. YJ47 TaxID=2798724 RepID=UPI00192317CC|nr:DUF2335 domain-containing protein [Croceicoccus sp. YJ47]QQN75032.1 DUF2335 domain-containing protein [Croceicoccus sp. YJ47]
MNNPNPGHPGDDEQNNLSGDVGLYTRDDEGNYVPVVLSPSDEGEGEGVEGEIYISQRQMHAGPLPSVEQFRGYGEVVPDAPERILKMAEDEQAAYHKFMQAQLNGRSRAVSQGQWMGFVAMMVALLGAIYLAITGHTAVAIGLASPAVITPIMRFYFQGKHETRQPNQDK